MTSKDHQLLDDNLLDRIGSAYSVHQAGRLDEAEQKYRALLVDYPAQVDVLFLLSSLLLKTGPATASDLARQSIDAAGWASSKLSCTTILPSVWR